MFEKLFDFGYERSPLGAVGFYISYFILLLLCAMLIGGIYGMLSDIGITSSGSNQEIFRQSAIFGWIFSTIACIILAIIIIAKKYLFKNFGAILLFLLSIIGPLLMGALLGLIPVAILSWMRNQRDDGKAES